MAYEHRNRRGDVYLLQAGKTAKGNPRYYFGRELTGEPIDEVPAGYEVHEAPSNAQVFLRKARPTKITPVEREIVTQAIRTLSNVEHFRVDVEGNALVVYVPDSGFLPETGGTAVNSLLQALGGPGSLFGARFQSIRERARRSSTYEKVMRFSLQDTKQRLFVASRWNFRGSIDDWMYLDGPASLSDLVEKYAEHLGEESFYELF